MSETFKPKGILLVTLKAGCPVAEANLDKLRTLAQQYRSRGIEVVGISGAAAQSVSQLQAWTSEADLPFPVFKDPGFQLIHALGITQTPEFVLLDSKFRKVYQGAFDDQYSPEHRRNQPVKSYLPEAVQALAEGKPVPVKRTEAQGCELEDLEAEHPGKSHLPPAYSSHFESELCSLSSRKRHCRKPKSRVLRRGFALGQDHQTSD